MTDREIITEWMDRIGEEDAAWKDSIIEQCTKDKLARAYYKKMALGEFGKTNAGRD